MQLLEMLMQKATKHLLSQEQTPSSHLLKGMIRGSRALEND